MTWRQRQVATNLLHEDTSVISSRISSSAIITSRVNQDDTKNIKTMPLRCRPWVWFDRLYEELPTLTRNSEPVSGFMKVEVVEGPINQRCLNGIQSFNDPRGLPSSQKHSAKSTLGVKINGSLL